MLGGTFLEKHGAHDDTVTVIVVKRTYGVTAAGCCQASSVRKFQGLDWLPTN